MWQGAQLSDMTAREWAQQFWERYWWELTDERMKDMPTFVDNRNRRDRNDLLLIALMIALACVAIGHIGFKPMVLGK